MITEFKIFESNNLEEILLSIETKDYDKVKEIIKKNPDIIKELNDSSFYEYTIFKKADLKSFKILLENGFEINDKQLHVISIIINMVNKKEIDNNINNMIDILFYLIDLDLGWVKNNDTNKEGYFLDYLPKYIINIIKEKYPKKYKEYLIDRDLDKFNI